MIEAMLMGAGGIEVEYSEHTRIVSGSGVLEPPVGAKAMRVAVIGAGAGGGYDDYADYYTDKYVFYGGAGGGCAASKIVKAEPITYSIGAGGLKFKMDKINDDGHFSVGGDTVAEFGSYALIGGGAGNDGVSNSTSAGRYAGVGSGGDYNFTGGLGGRASTSTTGMYAMGGGAAGPMGDGNGGLSSEGWGVGGGAGGEDGASSVYMISGRGPGNHMVSDVYGNQAYHLHSAGSIWADEFNYSGNAANIYRTPGMGGGGCGSNSSVGHQDGGGGGMVVEWFF